MHVPNDLITKYALNLISFLFTSLYRIRKEKAEDTQQALFYYVKVKAAAPSPNVLDGDGGLAAAHI